MQHKWCDKLGGNLDWSKKKLVMSECQQMSRMLCTVLKQIEKIFNVYSKKGKKKLCPTEYIAFERMRIKKYLKYHFP